MQCGVRARLDPDNEISGGKVLWVGTRKVNCRAATALRMAAQSLHHTKSALGDFYGRMRAKLGATKAIRATAHKLARIIFHLVTTRQEFDDSHFAADQLRFQTISWIPGYGSVIGCPTNSNLRGSSLRRTLQITPAFSRQLRISPFVLTDRH